jgi:hypothetical protein
MMQRILNVKMTPMSMMKKILPDDPDPTFEVGLRVLACSVNRRVGLFKAEMHSLKPAS